MRGASLGLAIIAGLATAGSARAEGPERFVLEVDPQVSCPGKADLDRAFGDVAAPAPGLRSLHIAPGLGGMLIVELRSAAGEILAVDDLAVGAFPCRELARTIALLAAAWSETFPLASIGPATPAAGLDGSALEPGPSSKHVGGLGTGHNPAKATVEDAAPTPATVVSATSVTPPVLAPSTPSAPEVAPGFRPGPLSVRLSGLAVFDLAPADVGAGGEAAVELGLGAHFSAGLSAAWLSNQTASDPSDNGGSLLLHRQRYVVFGGYSFAPRAGQWLSLQLGLEDQHLIAQTFGYTDAFHGTRDDPALSIHVLYAHALLGPLFAFALGGADILLVHQEFYVDENNGTQNLLSVSPVSLDLQLGLGLRFL